RRRVGPFVEVIAGERRAGYLRGPPRIGRREALHRVSPPVVAAVLGHGAAGQDALYRYDRLWRFVGEFYTPHAIANQFDGGLYRLGRALLWGQDLQHFGKLETRRPLHDTSEVQVLKVAGAELALA